MVISKTPCGIYISQLVQFARCCTSVLDFHSKNPLITSNYWYRVTDIKSFGKRLGSSLGRSKISVQTWCNIVSSICLKGITLLDFYCDLVYKLRKVKGAAIFISSGSIKVKRLQRHQYDQLIIERTIGIVLIPFTALHRSFLVRCTLSNKAMGTFWQALSKHPRIPQGGPDPRPFCLLFGTHSVRGPELADRCADHSLL